MIVSLQTRTIGVVADRLYLLLFGSTLFGIKDPTSARKATATVLPPLLSRVYSILFYFKFSSCALPMARPVLVL